MTSRTSTVSATPVMTSSRKVLFMTVAARLRCASPSSCCAAPRAIENSGMPPVPNRFANAVTISRIGKVRPTPVSALTESSGIWPMYMRSTILYRTLTSCATTIGMARRRMLPETFPLEKSLTACILLLPPQ